MATDTATQSALKQVEAELAANAAELQKEAPEQYAKMKRVLEAMKRAPPGAPHSDEVKRLVVDLLRWQFEGQRRAFDAQRAALAELAKETGEPAAAKAATAYGEVVKLLDQALAADFPPSGKAQAALGDAVARVKKAFEEAQAAASRSSLGIPMRTHPRPIASTSGVALKAVTPGPRAAAGGAPPPVKPPPPAPRRDAKAVATPSPPPPRPSGPIRELGVSGPVRPDGAPAKPGNGKRPPKKK